MVKILHKANKSLDGESVRKSNDDSDGKSLTEDWQKFRQGH